MEAYQDNVYDLIVVGAGAAGMMATLSAAERGKRVLLLEKMDQPGRKLRITGKGRCNLTNTASLQETLPHIGSDPRFLRNAYGTFFNKELMAFFESRGVPLVEERGGRVFPKSGKAQDVFMALIQAIESHSNVDIRKERRVTRLQIIDGALKGVLLNDGTILHAPRVVLATGGKSYPRTGSTGDGYKLALMAGHTVVPCVPSLVPLSCAEHIPTEMVGFQLKNVELTVTMPNGKAVCKEFGEMTFCKDGLAGPIVLSASRKITRLLNEDADPGLVAHIDLKPALSRETLDKRLINDLNANGTRILNDAMRLWLPQELITFALGRMRLPQYYRLNQVSGEMRRKLLNFLKDLSFTLTGTHDYDEAIATQGGVSLKEVNPKTMESKLLAGLYIVGELLDLDADTGGYNLQIAFSTGRAAGLACATDGTSNE
ncbi:MAG: NAD(P)/FAD-dependent oxidoreductase [Bacteroidales bacterium]|nr:NAD(P)/FAD-dependent oxidoreductase [Bacteroidales bacterium]